MAYSHSICSHNHSHSHSHSHSHIPSHRACESLWELVAMPPILHNQLEFSPLPPTPYAANYRRSIHMIPARSLSQHVRPPPPPVARSLAAPPLPPPLPRQTIADPPQTVSDTAAVAIDGADRRPTGPTAAGRALLLLEVRRHIPPHLARWDRPQSVLHLPLRSSSSNMRQGYMHVQRNPIT